MAIFNLELNAGSHLPVTNPAVVKEHIIYPAQISTTFRFLYIFCTCRSTLSEDSADEFRKKMDRRVIIIFIRPDTLHSEVNPKEYRAFVLPGGFYSYGFDEVVDPKIHRQAETIRGNGGYIATMCVRYMPFYQLNVFYKNLLLLRPDQLLSGYVCLFGETGSQFRLWLALRI